MTASPIYLDHQATTPVDPRVVDAMLPWLMGQTNPHSTHHAGRRAADAVEEARHLVASLIGARPGDIIFTSGATEAANIAIHALASPGGAAVASAIEHPCVAQVLRSLEPGVRIKWVEVDETGVVDPDQVAEAIDATTSLVAVMAVNNEIGTIQPSAEIGRLAGYADAAFLCDLTQAAGKIDVDVEGWNVGAGLLSAHKMHGPQGVGALCWRRPTPPPARTIGGGQERGMRSGTLPVALCVGFGHAARLAAAEMAADAERIRGLSQRMLAAVTVGVPDMRLNGSETARVPHNLNVSVPGIDAEALCGSLEKLSISTGSACSSGAIAPSMVLAALGMDDERLRGSFRIGLGRETTSQDVDRAAAMIVKGVDALKRGGSRRVKER